MALKDRGIIKFPALVLAESGILVEKLAGVYTFSLDTDFIGNYTGVLQLITAAGPVDINADTNIVIVNQDVGAAITLNMPSSLLKTGKVKVVDWKGDSGSNAITIVANGSDTFNGGVTSWIIQNNGASAVFDPYPGAGYAV